MNNITSSKNSTLLLLIAFVAALLFAIYYYLIIPKLDEVESKNSTVHQLRQEVASMEEQLVELDGGQVTSVKNSLAMRKKVPETRAIEQVILDMVEIEEVTGTRVESLNFTYDTDEIQLEVTEPDVFEQAEAKANGEQTETEENDPVATIVKENLPPGLKLVTFSLEVAALDFKALDGFLKEIEKLERIMKTDTISFKLPGEQDQLEEDADLTLKATVQITTFYYEGEN